MSSASIRVEINGRAFEIGCAAGEEERLRALAEHVVHRVDGLRQAHGAIGDERLLLMAALMLADDLWDSETARAAAEARATTAEAALGAGQGSAKTKVNRTKPLTGGEATATPLPRQLGEN